MKVYEKKVVTIELEEKDILLKLGTGGLFPPNAENKSISFYSDEFKYIIVRYEVPL